MHILDTDTLTHLLAGHKGVARRLTLVPDTDIATTVVTQIELLRGRFDFILKAATGTEMVRAQQLLARTEGFLSDLRIIPFGSEGARHFDRLRVEPGLRKIGRADVIIASIALARRATLVTRNRRHFRQVGGLELENWVD